jgi:hypothetical protein
MIFLKRNTANNLCSRNAYLNLCFPSPLTALQNCPTTAQRRQAVYSSQASAYYQILVC